MYAVFNSKRLSRKARGWGDHPPWFRLQILPDARPPLTASAPRGRGELLERWGSIVIEIILWGVCLVLSRQSSCRGGHHGRSVGNLSAGPPACCCNGTECLPPHRRRPSKDAGDLNRRMRPEGHHLIIKPPKRGNLISRWWLRDRPARQANILIAERGY